MQKKTKNLKRINNPWIEKRGSICEEKCQREEGLQEKREFITNGGLWLEESHWQIK